MSKMEIQKQLTNVEETTLLWSKDKRLSMEAVIAELEAGLEYSEKERIRVRNDSMAKWAKCEKKWLE